MFDALGRCRFEAVLLSCLLALAGHPVLADDVSASRTITYYDHASVTVPATVERVATAWPAQNAIVAMLGWGDRIVATSNIIRDQPVFRKFVPTIKDAAIASTNDGGDINVELMIALHPDIIFAPESFPPAKKAQLEAGGIAVASLHGNSIDALVERTVITGQILGGAAVERAARYKAYFEDNKRRVAQALAHIPPEKRLKVYLSSGSPLATSARPSLNQDWMDLGGAINVAETWSVGNGGYGGTANTSVEAVVAADPDVIIALRAADAEAIRRDPQWQNIKAVREGRVYANPRGMFWWCRETSEEALQFLWLAKTLYPDALRDVDMRHETKAFYKEFYGYDLSDADVEDFLVPAR